MERERPNPLRRHPRRFSLFVAALLVTAAALAGLSCSTEKPAPQVARADGALRVLFLGNSYTYYYNLPRLVGEFAAAAGKKIETRMIAPGGVSLADHLEDKKTIEAIRTGRWDFVVLQEQSALGAVYLVNGAAHVANPEAFFTAARRLDAEIHAAGAKPVFYHTWPRRDAPPSDRAMLDYAHMRIARELHATVAPVGLAWQQALAEISGADLYDADGSHPSSTGSYLAAAVLYATLTGASPVGGPAKITVAPVNPDSGAVTTGAATTLVELPARFAGELQRIAWQNHEKLTAAGGYLDLPAPAPLALPQMPTGGRRPRPEEITGRWLGSLKLYPQPATFELWISPKKDKPGDSSASAPSVSKGSAPAGWTAAIELRFATGQQDKVTNEVEQFEITSAGITFVNPNGPNGGIIKFRATFHSGAGSPARGHTLTGVAEIIVADAPIYAIGAFDLKRIR